MIEVRIPFRDAYNNSMHYVEQQLEAAGFPPYMQRDSSKGITKHWWEDPPGEFVYQWIPWEEYREPTFTETFGCTPVAGDPLTPFDTDGKP